MTTQEPELIQADPSKMGWLEKQREDRREIMENNRQSYITIQEFADGWNIDPSSEHVGGATDNAGLPGVLRSEGSMPGVFDTNKHTWVHHL